MTKKDKRFYTSDTERFPLHHPFAFGKWGCFWPYREKNQGKSLYFIGAFLLGFVLVAGLNHAAGWAKSAEAAETSETVSQQNAALPKAGILLTFDDSGNIPCWGTQIPLLQKYGARATFFLNEPEKISDEQWGLLDQLRAIGCAVGVHGVHHERSVEMVESVGGEEFLRQEIEPVRTILQQHGISTTSFAYPFSRRNDETDRLLMPFFGHLRTGDAPDEGKTLAECDRFFTPRLEIDRRFCFIGKGCDRVDDAALERDIFPALLRVKERDEILVFYAHNIAGEGAGHRIAPDMLEKILQRANELDLAFYTYDDLPAYRPEQTSEASSTSAEPKIELKFDPRRIVEQGSDGVTCWTHARAAAVPGGLALMTAQKLLLTGMDVFYAIHSSISDDGGQTWSPLTEQSALGRITGPDALEAVPCDGTPAWHATSGKILITGQTAFYENNHDTEKRFSLVSDLAEGQAETTVWYAVFDPATRTWGTLKFLTVPSDSESVGCGSGCSQRFDLEDGTILLPVCGMNPRTPDCAKTLIVHCAFDGETLTWLSEGKPLEWPTPRGFGEASLTRFNNRFYLTLRNDEKGYVTAGDDGLNFDDPIPWRWTDGAEIGNYNTQQHWLVVGGRLALVYTRRAEDNDHVFRHRAPLFCAQVDPATLALKKETEQRAVPERGARLGNFGVTTFSPDESWIVVSEWMQSNRGGGKEGYDDCIAHGATGAIWLTRVITEK